MSEAKRKLLFVFGTRPEAIKMAPLVKVCKKESDFEVVVCTTGQHKEMLQQVMTFFGIVADYELQLMQPNQTINQVTAAGLVLLEDVLVKVKPDLVLVQGDTTTAYIGALSAFFQKIKIAHVEAGLRSFDKYAPYPEEVFRKMVSTMADYHFVPTPKAAQNLVAEGYSQNIIVTGNTVIDALLWGVKEVVDSHAIANYFSFLNFNERIILVTGHRRENFGVAFENICEALLRIASAHNVQIVYPVHLNPNVQNVVYSKLAGQPTIHLIDPLDYPHLIWLMNKSYIVLTDSGGIQEEAPSLGKPVLVMRDVTERQEGIEANNAVLVGTSVSKIVTETERLLTDEAHYRSMSEKANPYGDGNAAILICDYLKTHL